MVWGSLPQCHANQSLLFMSLSFFVYNLFVSFVDLLIYLHLYHVLALTILCRF